MAAYAELPILRQLTRAYGSLLSLADAAQSMKGSLGVLAAVAREQHGGILAPAPVAQPAERIGGTQQVDIHVKLGLQLLLDRSSLVDRTVIETGSWEPGQVAYMTGLAQRYRSLDKPVFLDIGAYWGLYSLLMAKTKIFQEIHTFEADAFNFGQLQANLFLNRASRDIRALNKAVSLREGMIDVWDSLGHPDGNRGGVGIAARGVHFPISEVECVTVDKFLHLQDRDILVKIDVEGHERDVLLGMEATLRNNRVIMQVEIYEPQMAGVLPILESYGMRRFHQIDHDFYYTNIDGVTGPA
ncbi:FkbM family methyltransferase [Pseudoduganella chitinolytica]|uniref:FkbM family methyltransferase n=1 Tax=Pseudoduganella chitinolytica TaxID=34070 RepID=A0ABY8BII8_9BURK|nr:FkbM family methyltransferase [Pseudoduganella chitinolytica]WEF35777.1 FkbM family methyltransferase [Pseudoduganella chitinolytica]